MSTIANIQVQSEHLSDQMLPKDWATSNQSYDANQVIDAYFMGKTVGEQETKRKLIQQFKTKIRLSTSVAEELFSLANESGYKFDSVYLRYVDKNSFDAIYFVDEELYMSSEMKKAFMLSRELREKYKSEDFQISFLFSPNSKTINTDSLFADGYFIKYDKK